MEFPRQLYDLRRQRGLSQEQLAEALGVSRQSISKWESGQTMPEPEKLVAISNYFGASLDTLLKGEPEPPPAPQPPPAPMPRGMAAGTVLVLVGVVCLVLWGVLTTLHPAAVETLNDSSMITLNGSGLLLLGCAASMALGTFLLLRKK